MIALVYQTLGDIVLMLLLVAGAAFFSGAETAFFNITQRQLKQFEASQARLQKLAAHLLRNPGHLLNCLLLGNMMVNVLYFAIASVLIVHVRHLWGFGGATAVALTHLPRPGALRRDSAKVLGLFELAVAGRGGGRTGFSRGPVPGADHVFFRMLFLEPVLRVLFGPARWPSMTTLAEFRSLVSLSRRRGLISEDEDRLLGEVVELGIAQGATRHAAAGGHDRRRCDGHRPSRSASSCERVT